jgi:mRNA-degrading endonuclease RelE of RelBE toxin-antitoxin system
MPWRVDISRRAGRDLNQLNVEDRNAVLAALRRLSDDPASVDLWKLAGTSSGWRLRVGRWRIILEATNRRGTMRVDRVLDWRDAYRG